MIRRTRDPVEVNALLGRDFEGLDATDLLEEPLNVCLIDDDDGAMFAWRGPNTYEAHVFFASRGRKAVQAIRAMLDWMCDECGARRFWALVPERDRKVRIFARLVGWRSLGLRETRHGTNELFTSEGPCP